MDTKKQRGKSWATFSLQNLSVFKEKYSENFETFSRPLYLNETVGGHDGGPHLPGGQAHQPVLHQVGGPQADGVPLSHAQAKQTLRQQ